MGIAKGDKENYLNLYLTKFNKEAIEDIISDKVEKLKWEYYFQAKKIDIYGETMSGKSIFIENQITFAHDEDRHLKSVLSIIGKAPHNSVVIWGAKGFSSKVLEKISKIILDIKYKKIEFYAVEVNSNILPILERLNSMHILYVMDQLPLLHAVDTYVDIFDKYVSSCDGCIEKREYKFERMTDRERTNAYIIQELRNRVKYPNVFREKRTIDINKLRYGAGRSCCDFELVYSNRNADSYVSCEFASQTATLYQEVVKRKDILEDKIGGRVECDDLSLRIISFVKEFEHKFDKIDRLVELLDKYIFYLSNYTFYFGTDMQDYMWEQHEEGALEI